MPYLGAIRDGLKGKGGVTLLAMLLLAGYAISQISTGLKQRRLGTGPSRELPVDRRLIAARFPRAATSDQDELLARWPALLVHEDGATFALVLAPTRDDFDAVLADVRDHSPSSLVVTQPSGDLSLPELDGAAIITHDTEQPSLRTSREDSDARA